MKVSGICSGERENVIWKIFI